MIPNSTEAGLEAMKHFADVFVRADETSRWRALQVLHCLMGTMSDPDPKDLRDLSAFCAGISERAIEAHLERALRN